MEAFQGQKSRVLDPAYRGEMTCAAGSGIEDVSAERGQYLAELEEDELPDMERMATIYTAHASRVLGPPIAIE